MCGIVGYIGHRDAFEVLLEGLTRLEYRGYDSAGVALMHQHKTEIYRAKGKLKVLKKELYKVSPEGTVGIGHTRWATHGAPTTENAHPHRSGATTIVHNGIIENFKYLREALMERGVVFQSDTDSEIIAHLIERYHKELPFEAAVAKAISKIEGAFAVLVLNETERKLICFKQHSPMIIGVGDGEQFIASDVPAILSYTNRFIYLEDGEMAVITDDEIKICDFDLAPRAYDIKTLNISPVMAEKGNYKHFMLKEIHEQPRALSDTFRGRVIKGGTELDLDLQGLRPFIKTKLRRIVVIACGTSWHSGLVGKYMIEQMAEIPVEVDYASEYRYRKPIVGDDTLVIAISQSGETADTLAAINMAKERGAKILSICNVQHASIPRISDLVLYTYAGPEIGVASTKAFVTQLSILGMLAIGLTEIKKGSCCPGLLKKLLYLPEQVDRLLEQSKAIEKLAKKYHRYRNFLYLGRNINFPIALEGALKLKEISYIHAEGYPAGEMKHGPIALIDEQMPTIMIATDGNSYDKVVSNLQEIKARGGLVIALVSEGNNALIDSCDDIITIPKTDPMWEPFLNVIPLQLFAYYVADLEGTDVDQPRNLAKSVTVE